MIWINDRKRFLNQNATTEEAMAKFGAGKRQAGFVPQPVTVFDVLI